MKTFENYKQTEIIVVIAGISILKLGLQCIASLTFELYNY